MLIVVTVLLSDLIPLRERGTYQGYLNLIGAVGSTTGGPIGWSPSPSNESNYQADMS